jgi:hypothetical protein
MRILKGLMLAIALAMPACYLGDVVYEPEPAIVYYQGGWGYWMSGIWYAAPYGFVWGPGVHPYWGYYYHHYNHPGPGRIGHGGWRGGHFGGHRR